ALRPRWYSGPDGPRSAYTGSRAPCARWSSRPLSTPAGPRHTSAAAHPGRPDPRLAPQSLSSRANLAFVARSDWPYHQARAPTETGSPDKVDARWKANKRWRSRRSEVDSRKSLFLFCRLGAARLQPHARSVAFSRESLQDRPASVL